MQLIPTKFCFRSFVIGKKHKSSFFHSLQWCNALQIEIQINWPQFFFQIHIYSVNQITTLTTAIYGLEQHLENITSNPCISMTAKNCNKTWNARETLLSPTLRRKNWPKFFPLNAKQFLQQIKDKKPLIFLQDNKSVQP